MTIAHSQRRQEKNQRDDVMDFARQNYSVQKLSKKQQLLVENWMPWRTRGLRIRVQVG
jgi:hypothetical protein